MKDRKYMCVLHTSAAAAISSFCIFGLPSATVSASESAPPTTRQESLSEFDKSDDFVKLSNVVGQISVLLPTPKGIVSKAVCSAIQISADYVLTARHCFEDATGGSLSYTEADITFGKPGNGAVTIKLDHDPDAGTDDDYAVLHSTESLGTKFLPMVKIGAVPVAHEGLFILHYPGGGPLSLTRMDCHASDPPSQGVNLHHTCDTMEGSSGAPIFNDRFEIVGIQLKSGRDPKDGNSFNTGIMLTEIMKDNLRARKEISKLGSNAQLAAPSAPTVEIIFNFSDGETLVKRGDQWLLRSASNNGNVQTSVLVKQEIAGESLVFWDRNSDRILRVPPQGGTVSSKSPDDAVWGQLTDAKRIK